MREFISFPSIERLQQNITITEKIHGTNAQILIEESATSPDEIVAARANGVVLCESTYQIWVGSRSRWITPEDDNYGFAAWVRASASELVRVLGVDRHFGEWYGRGINAGYGMNAPLRLEKLLSRDEAFTRDYPQSLPQLVSAYVADLIRETEGLDEAVERLVRKGAFVAIKGMMRERGYTA